MPTVVRKCCWCTSRQVAAGAVAALGWDACARIARGVRGRRRWRACV